MSQGPVQKTKTEMLRNVVEWAKNPLLTPEQRVALLDSYVKLLRAAPRKVRRGKTKAKPQVWTPPVFTNDTPALSAK